MRVQLIELRTDGIPVPRHEIKMQIVYTGELEIFDTRDAGYNRNLKVAVFTSELNNARRLLDVELVWLNGDLMGLKGFEQRKTDRGTVDFAQSWRIKFLPATPAKEDAFGREFNQRR